MQESDLQHQLLTHLIDAASIKSDVEHLKANAAANSNQVIGMLGALTAKVEGLQAALNAVPERISSCRDDMRREVEKDFPNRTDAILMENRIEEQVRATDEKLSAKIDEVTTGLKGRMDKIERKIDSLLVKIGVGLTVATVLLSAFWWAINNVSPTVLKQTAPQKAEQVQ